MQSNKMIDSSEIKNGVILQILSQKYSLLEI